MISLFAKRRKNKSDSYLNSIRKNNLLPGILYGKHINNILIIINVTTIINIINYIYTRKIDLIIDSTNNRFNCIVKKLQYSPVNDNLLHIDFQYINKNQFIYINIPLKFINIDYVNNNLGKKVHIYVKYINIKSIFKNIPIYISIDLLKMNIKNKIRIKDIKTYNKFTILNISNIVICSIK